MLIYEFHKNDVIISIKNLIVATITKAKKTKPKITAMNDKMSSFIALVGRRK